jgi:hypothetical protein
MMNIPAPDGVILSDQQLRDRILGAAASEPSVTRGERRWRNALLFVMGSAAALAIFILWGGVRPHGRPLWLIMTTASGSALLGTLALTVALGRGRSMLGRSRRMLAGSIVPMAVALVLWKTGVSALFDGMNVAWPARPGFRCLALALAVGLVPLVLGLLARRRSDPVQPAAAGAALGAACGLAAATLVDLWCPVAHLPHLLVGHLLPVALLALVGAVAGSKVLAIRFEISIRQPTGPR